MPTRESRVARATWSTPGSAGSREQRPCARPHRRWTRRL